MQITFFFVISKRELYFHSFTKLVVCVVTVNSRKACSVFVKMSKEDDTTVTGLC